jgi:hypothetical protein
MSETELESDKTSTGGRGPSYPFISLQEAIARARKFFDAEGKNAAPVAAAVEHWGYAAKSSGGRQTVAALLQFGLLRDEGSGDTRKVALSKMGLDILLREAGSQEQREFIANAARQPKLYRELLTNYSGGLPSDATLRHYLIASKDVPSAAVDGLIKNFRATAAFAGLFNSVNIPNVKVEGEKPPIVTANIGDLVQWESGGALQFEKPRRVRAIQQHDGADWVFVDGSTTGILMSEVTVEGRGDAQKVGQPPLLAEDPQRPGEREWIRGPLAKDISYRIMVSGDLGPKEIAKLIRLLEAQRLVLSDDEEESES